MLEKKLRSPGVGSLGRSLRGKSLGGSFGGWFFNDLLLLLPLDWDTSVVNDEEVDVEINDECCDDEFSEFGEVFLECLLLTFAFLDLTFGVDFDLSLSVNRLTAPPPEEPPEVLDEE